MQVRKFRVLRLRHHISCAELAREMGITPQRISQLELDLTYQSSKAAQPLKRAFSSVIARRAGELESLQTDFLKAQDSLMEPVEETGYEL